MYALFAGYMRESNQSEFFFQSNVFEFFFLLDLFFNFLTDFKTTKKMKVIVVRELDKIVERYLRGEFIWDFVSCVPLQMIPMPVSINNLFYIIKILRLRKVMVHFKISELMRYIKKKRLEIVELELKIKKSPSDIQLMSEGNQMRDYNRIEEILYLSFFLKTIKLLIVILSIAFFFAMFFKIVTVMEMLVITQTTDLPYDCEDDSEHIYFIACYNL